MVRIRMKEHIQEAIVEFGERMTRRAATPATRGLFVVDEKSEPLVKKKADRFVSVVMKLLWVCKRGRPDIETPVSFLCTRLSVCTEQDWAKLRRLMHFLHDTIDDERIISAENLVDLFTWIDASYAVHNDMRSHTGGTMSFGRGVIHSKSSKQRINTKSSTESEVVGVSDYLPYNIWVEYFLEAQGYTLRSNIIYQDNQSAIRMEKNGRDSCGQKSRHIHIRYFFIKDRIRAGNVSVEFCPTELMLADFFTKPLQGSLFKKFRRVVMGYDPLSVLQDEYAARLKERAEK